jgi:hypothetical protein
MGIIRSIPDSIIASVHAIVDPFIKQRRPQRGGSKKRKFKSKRYGSKSKRHGSKSKRHGSKRRCKSVRR